MSVYIYTGSLQDPGSGNGVEVFSNQPGVQLYTGNFLDGSYTGRDCEPLARHSGVCLETQAWPNAINIKVSSWNYTGILVTMAVVYVLDVWLRCWCFITGSTRSGDPSTRQTVHGKDSLETELEELTVELINTTNNYIEQIECGK